MSDQFAFLRDEWPEIHQAAAQAAAVAHTDPRTACFHARRALELAMQWAFKFDASLRMPYDDNLSALIHEPTFRAAAGHGVFQKAHLIKSWGNAAVHNRAVKLADALSAVRELFHFCYWFARNYARRARPAPSLAFDANALPKTSPLPKQTVDQLQTQDAELQRLRLEVVDMSAMADELNRVRAELAEIKQARANEPDTHDYSEAETRDEYIDLLLKEAGWELEEPQDREFEVAGMPNAEGKGFVDYVLWGDDGKPLAVVEAKRTKRSAQLGQQQAKLYADCLEQRYGQRPVIFYTNGYEHWLWDDVSYPPRQVQGFYKKSELALLIQRRTSKKSLASATINQSIVDRYYQTRAIRRIGEAFERDKDRKALVVMATGSGKTRTVIALCDLLMRCNWVKRVLFLADRVALVNQAANAFKQQLPDSAPVNLVTEKDTDGRVYVSTYPTMMGLIDDTGGGPRRFGSGHFDLIVIDEAHRSVYQKYRAIFGYFDALLVGLTATPKESVDANTYSLFELETGVPTDAYDLRDAIQDGFLVPPQAVSVPLKFQREGITYDDLSETEQEQWDEAEWDEDGSTPAHVEAPAVNKWLFNTDTVDKVLEHLMTRGQKVAGGDRLGKSIIFAKNQTHAEFIAERFDLNYPHYKGSFARVVHCNLPYVQSVIDSFSLTEKEPHVAISVDMLDTGIDVPDVVNLVFFKLVRSKTKFWQMLGRGTRLRPDLFGPGKHKRFFFIFDYCQNLEFFKENPEITEGSVSDSLGKRLFKTRLELVGELDRSQVTGPNNLRVADGGSLREDTVGLLHAEVAAMNVNNFVVRPKRRLVEQYAQRPAWNTLDANAHGQLAHEVAGLPAELEAEEQEAKRFDLLLLRIQLGLIKADPAFARLRDQVKGLASVLEEKASIPVVKRELELILQVQTDEWWEGVTLPLLETVRKRLRSLVKLIDKRKRKPIYTDFEDQLGLEEAVELPGFTTPDQFERFRSKVRAFLRQHQDHVTIHKLRTNTPLTPSDLAELERMLLTSGAADEAALQQAREDSAGLGLFVRSLIGLDREAAKKAFSVFLDDRTFSASQIEFVNLIVNHLTEQGVMSARLLYESPFTDIAPTGPDGLFDAKQVERIMAALYDVEAAALGK
jgi:type I restriction enzyme, R subunit